MVPQGNLRALPGKWSGFVPIDTETHSWRLGDDPLIIHRYLAIGKRVLVKITYENSWKESDGQSRGSIVFEYSIHPIIANLPIIGPFKGKIQVAFDRSEGIWKVTECSLEDNGISSYEEWLKSYQPPGLDIQPENQDKISSREEASSESNTEAIPPDIDGTWVGLIEEYKSKKTWECRLLLRHSDSAVQFEGSYTDSGAKCEFFIVSKNTDTDGTWFETTGGSRLMCRLMKGKMRLLVTHQASGGLSLLMYTGKDSAEPQYHAQLIKKE